MRKVSVALALAALLPAAARAEPIAVRVESSTQEFQTGTSLITQSLTILTVPRGGIGFFMSAVEPGTWATFTLEGTNGRNTLRAAILSGLSASGFGMSSMGFALWNNGSGGGAWQDGFLGRSAAFAGANGPDENANRGLVLLLSGLTGAENARVALTFGGTSMLALGSSAVSGVHTPEPASMLLIGTGLLGLAGLYRRRRRE